MRVMISSIIAVLAVGMCSQAGAGLFNYFDYAIEDATADSMGAFHSGQDETLTIQGYAAAPPIYSLGSEKWVFLKFDISEIPEWAQIVKAEFGIYMVARNGGGAATVDPHAALYLVSNDTWDQMNITWASKPGYVAGYVDDEKALAESNQYYAWNLLSDLGQNSWTNQQLDIQDGYLSLLLRVVDPDLNNYAVFNSTEATQFQPYLKIAYVPEPASVLLLGIGGFLLRRRK